MRELVVRRTSSQAGRLAARVGARRLVLAHFSRRYPDETAFTGPARSERDVVAAEGPQRIPVPHLR